MRINAKALNTKPSVSLMIAVGGLHFDADGLMDSCILTALFKAFNGKDKALANAIEKAAKVAAKRMSEYKPTFEMRKRKARAS